MAACFCAIGCLPWSPLASRNPEAHRGCGAVIPSAMLRIHGDRTSLLAALAATWAESQLAIPQQVLAPRGSAVQAPIPAKRITTGG